MRAVSINLIQSNPLSNMASIVCQMKIMGSEHGLVMQLDNKIIPHEVSFARVTGGHTFDFRVSTFPTIYGEKITTRIFDKDSCKTTGTEL